MPIALTRDVGPAIVDCELTHLARAAIDVARARAQHAAYEALLRDLGCEVRRIAPAPGLPDAVFVEDAAVVLDPVAVITRPGAATRRRETASVAEALAPLRPLRRMDSPATLDGGDVLVLDHEIVIGLSSRTSDAGARQFASLVTPFGYRVRTIPVTECLHLKSAVTRIGEHTLLMNPEWTPRDAFTTWECVAVDPAEPFAANALLVAGTVIHPVEYPRTAERIANAGAKVRPVPADELAKAEGGVTCCSLIVTGRDNAAGAGAATR